ncbi:MAG: phage holin family protein [bacterium]
MEPGKISDNFSELTENVKKYINLRIDLVKLILTEKLARMAMVFLLINILFIVSMFLLLFLSFGFIYWYGEMVGPMWEGALIVAGVYLLIGVIILVFRVQIIMNPLIQQISKVLMEEKDENEE